MKKLIWLDLETTGLEPASCHILEIAAMQADFDRPFTPSLLLNKALFNKMSQEKKARLHPDVQEMHTKNGLFEDCFTSNITLSEVEEWLCTLFPQEADKEERPILAGSTISFDHEFIKVHMPQFAKRLSYRQYDVSAIKLFCQSLGMPKFEKKETHRALPDIRESIAHAEACAEWLSSMSLDLQPIRTPD